MVELEFAPITNIKVKKEEHIIATFLKMFFFIKNNSVK